MLSKKILKTEIKGSIGQFVYGATDGTVTTFAVVAGSQGGGLSPKAALTLGFANLIADGISMGISTFLSEETTEQVKADKHSRKLANALMTFASFVSVGSIPLLSYIYYFIGSGSDKNLFLTSSLLSLGAFTFIGLVRARVTSRSYAYCVFETCALGAVAAGAAFIVGNLIEGWIG